MPIKLKICGLTSLADARFCAGAGADFLGFVFHPDSPRHIEPARVREIADWLHGPEITGVFVDVSPETVNHVASEAGLTYVQLHGDESPDDCTAIDLPVIKAIRIGADDDGASVRRRMEAYRGRVDYFLLDTHHPELPGGTGETFDWSIAAGLSADFPILLAGGLRPENIVEAIETVNPIGIDLSSGIESAPGVKDFDLLGDLFDAFDAVRDAQPAYNE